MKKKEQGRKDNSLGLSWNDAQARMTIAQMLIQGNIVVGDSDTVLGLLAPVSLAGRRSLDALKGRSNKPYLILVDSRLSLEEFTETPLAPYVDRLMKSFWPGPLTLVLRARSTAPEYVLSPENTVAVRMPDHEGLLDIMKQTGPLFSTSANLAGHPVPRHSKDLDPALVHAVSVQVYNGQKTDRQALPSTIIDCTGLTWTIVRSGAVSQKALTDALL